jgi:GNAT superfamily N-acetyltransferase
MTAHDVEDCRTTFGEHPVRRSVVIRHLVAHARRDDISPDHPRPSGRDSTAVRRDARVETRTTCRDLALPTGVITISAMGKSMELVVNIRQATLQDAGVVSDVLKEAARWLNELGMPLWREDELESGRIAADVAEGLFFIAESSRDAAGTVRFQLEDPIFWPDVPLGEAAFIHRLAVRRRYAGSGLSTALLRWAVERTRRLGRRYLRLDCEASRPRLRSIYETFGFRHRDNRQAGSYFVSRYEYDVN